MIGGQHFLNVQSLHYLLEDILYKESEERERQILYMYSKIKTRTKGILASNPDRLKFNWPGFEAKGI